MLKLLKFGGIIIYFAVVLSAAAYPATWQDVAALSRNNDDYVSAKKQLDSAEWTYKKAYSAFLPQLSASAGYSETLPPFDLEKSYSLGLSATQSIFNGMKNYYGLKSAFASYQYYLENLKKTGSDVHYNIRVAFIELYIAQENLDLSNQILARIKENARMIRLRYDSGREDKGNLLTTVASQKDAEYGVASAKRELDLSRLKIFQLVSSEIRATDGTIDISMETDPDFNSLIENSPSYKMAEYQLESSDIAAQNTIGGFLPSVSLSASDRKTGEEWPPDTLSSKSWSLNFSYSFFPGGSNIAEKFINDLNLDKAKRDFESSKKSLRFSIEDAFRSAKNAIDSLGVKRAQLDAAAERAKIADAKYQNGLTTFDEWNRITNDNITAQRSFLQAKKVAFESVAAWKNSYGGREE
jgi:outer membrane protein TolC